MADRHREAAWDPDKQRNLSCTSGSTNSIGRSRAISYLSLLAVSMIFLPSLTLAVYKPKCQCVSKGGGAQETNLLLVGEFLVV